MVTKPSWIFSTNRPIISDYSQLFLINYLAVPYPSNDRILLFTTLRIILHGNAYTRTALHGNRYERLWTYGIGYARQATIGLLFYDIMYTLVLDKTCSDQCNFILDNTC